MNCRDQFQIIVAYLKAKRNNVADAYDAQWRALARVIEDGYKTLLHDATIREYKLKQQLDSLNQACDLAKTILNNFDELFKTPNKIITDMYLELCSLRVIVGVPQLAKFCIEHPINRALPVKRIKSLSPEEEKAYLDEFIKTHNVNISS